MGHPTNIDALMETASQKLSAMDYAACEQLCLQALEAAKQANDFDRIARILMPLQEARRWRRQAALDAGVHVIGHKRTTDELLQQHEAGCLLLQNPPYTTEDEKAVREAALHTGRPIEVLLLDADGLRAAFAHALQERGDAILAKLPRDADATITATALLDQLDEIGDHEIAHQRLAEAAQQAARG